MQRHEAHSSCSLWLDLLVLVIRLGCLCCFWQWPRSFLFDRQQPVISSHKHKHRPGVAIRVYMPWSMLGKSSDAWQITSSRCNMTAALLQPARELGHTPARSQWHQPSRLCRFASAYVPEEPRALREHFRDCWAATWPSRPSLLRHPHQLCRAMSIHQAHCSSNISRLLLQTRAPKCWTAAEAGCTKPLPFDGQPHAPRTPMCVTAWPCCEGTRIEACRKKAQLVTNLRDAVPRACGVTRASQARLNTAGLNYESSAAKYGLMCD